MADWTSLVNALNTSVVSTFGTQVLYTPADSNLAAHTVQGILETPRTEEETPLGMFAILFLRLADLPAPPVRGDEVTIDQLAYKVFEIESDQAGGVRLVLHQK